MLCCNDDTNRVMRRALSVDDACRSLSIDPRVACLYWNTTSGSWRMDGVALVALEVTASGISVGCATAHLTSFAVGTGFLCKFGHDCCGCVFKLFNYFVVAALHLTVNEVSLVSEAGELGVSACRITFAHCCHPTRCAHCVSRH